jgi:hypothetical protein
MRCVDQVPVTTWALAASAASTSPRRIFVCDSTLPCFGLTWGAPGASAASGEVSTGGRTSYSTSTSAAAARAVCAASTAATAASTSPT